MPRLHGFPLALAAAATFAVAAPARAAILVTVDKASQQMTVKVDGDPRYVWPVATGRAGYNTPTGQFHPKSMERMHYSRQWDDAPMPFSIFFTNQGHAIHGTNHTITGRAASHGCVRLSVAHAHVLYKLVKAEGLDNTRVVLTGHIGGRDTMIASNDGGVTGDISARSSVAPEYDDDAPLSYDDPPPPRRERRYYRRRNYFRVPFFFRF
jgi:hypothetical protein